MNERTRTITLVALLALVGGLVALDTLRKRADNDGAPEPSSFAQRAASYERDRALVESEDAWRRARERATEAWDRVRTNAIEGSTADLALADFRALLVDAAREQGLEIVSTDRNESTAIENTAGVLHALEVRLSVASHDIAALMRYIDRVEHMEPLRTHVSALEFVGPGLPQAPERTSVTLTVRSLGITPPETEAGA